MLILTCTHDKQCAISVRRVLKRPFIPVTGIAVRMRDRSMEDDISVTLGPDQIDELIKELQTSNIIIREHLALELVKGKS